MNNKQELIYLSLISDNKAENDSSEYYLMEILELADKKDKSKSKNSLEKETNTNKLARNYTI